MEKKSFEILNAINVNGHTEKKNGLTYLSWAWAWAEVKKAFPEATYTVYENANGWNYHTDGRTCWVKTGVTIDGIEHIEYLPVMDFKNRSIPADTVTSFDVNKAIQRSLTKAVARHGLGLYIYAGEDLPENILENDGKTAETQQEPKKANTRSVKKQEPQKAPISPTQAVINFANAEKISDSWLSSKFGKSDLERLSDSECANILEHKDTVIRMWCEFASGVEGD